MATAVDLYSLSENAPAHAAPLDTLAALAGHASQLAGSDLGVAVLVERVGSLAFYTLRAESIRIVLRNESPDGSRLEEFLERRGAEEEAAPESSAAFATYRPEHHLPIQPFIFGVMLIAALAGVAVRLPRRRGPAYSLSRVRYADRHDPRLRRRRP